MDPAKFFRESLDGDVQPKNTDELAVRPNRK
jgi:hypothetical protein